MQMLRLLPVIAVVLAVSAPAASAAGVTQLELPDARPGQVSRPFTIVIGQADFEPRINQFRVEVEGFDVDNGQEGGQRVGTVDFDTDQGPFPGRALTAKGGGYYNLEMPSGLSIEVTIGSDLGLDPAGTPVSRAGSTLLTFQVPAELPSDARIRTLTLRFNVGADNAPTVDAGAINPATPGTYAVRSWVQATDGSVETAQQTVTIAPAPAQLKVKRNGRRFRVSNQTGEATTVQVKRGRKVLKELAVPAAGTARFTYRPRRKDRGKKVRLAFVPETGAAKRVSFRIPKR